MSISETVSTYLNDQNIEYELVHHPITYSSHETALAAHVDEDHIAKAVIVKDKKGYAMVVITGSDWVEMNDLKAEINRNFELADESELKKLFSDCKLGAIPPLGQAYGMETYLDDRLSTLANIYLEAGDHENLLHIHSNEFHKLFKGVRHGHFSH